jgi:predicted dehydrogenase
MSADASPRLRVGIIGCGEITQCSHIPTLNNLSHLYQTTYLCDVSKHALNHCLTKVQGQPPKTTLSAEELCSSSTVDVVLVANADAYHVPHALLALKHVKYCLLEKPAALNFRDIDSLIEAEKISKGGILVGTMRRYATAFKDAVDEVGGMPKIIYARVRDIIGPNELGVAQSGMYPKRFDDFSDDDNKDRLAREQDMHEQALREEFGVPVTQSSRLMLRVLGA